MGHLAFKDGKTVYERDMNEIGEMLVDALREINDTLGEILEELKGDRCPHGTIGGFNSCIKCQEVKG